MPLALTLLAAVCYGVAWYRLARRGHRWPARRAACLLAGSLCVGVALLPPVASHDDRFEVHVVQHLLLAMAAPVFLALSAPVTLALRTVPLRVRRALRRVLHNPPGGGVAAPATPLAPGLGGPLLPFPTRPVPAARPDNLIPPAGALHMFFA